MTAGNPARRELLCVPRRRLAALMGLWGLVCAGGVCEAQWSQPIQQVWYTPEADASLSRSAAIPLPVESDDGAAMSSWTPAEYSGHAVIAAPSTADVAAPAAPDESSPPLVRPSSLFHMPPSPCVSVPCSAQRLPEGLLYKSYLAGEKEPRISTAWLNEDDRGLVWDVTLGGRVGLWRYGTPGTANPEGFQFDMEGGALIRLDPEANTDVEAVDFRFGLLATFREGPWAAKLGYYHVSSHVGDEYLLRNPGFRRINYVRDSAIAGLSYDVTPSVRVYGEAGYAIGHEGGALPLEFQYGAEYSSLSTSDWGGPYAAINGHTREDNNWITGVNVVSGWQWRGAQTQHRFRIGMQYYQGPALQYSFLGQTERLIGGGLWFDY